MKMPESSLQPVPEYVHEAEGRGNWGSKYEFILATIGLAVGLGNIWRFSALAYENGGSAFVIPYIILAIFFGLPTMFLEMSLGQYTSSGPSTVFRHYMPALQGIGWSMTLISFTVCIYYCLIVAWSFLYLFYSFNDGLSLWESCDNKWNDVYCIVRSKMEECKTQDPDRPIAFNGTCISTAPGPMRTPFDQFFMNVVTRRSEGMGYIGSLNWPSFITLIGAWVLIFSILIEGYKYLGKVAYFTSTAPYLIIVVLFCRAITLEGSLNGLYYYWGKPDFSKLLKHQTWSAALIQICFSINIGYGGIVMLSSYNNKNNNCYVDAWVVVIGDFLMSVFGGAAVFATLGYLSHQLQKPIDEVVSSGHSLAFVAYPEAISKMPYPTIWAIFFFFMLFLLGISSEVALAETFCTSIYDQWPSTRAKKWIVSLISCVLLFMCAVILTTESGFYWFTIFDGFCGSTSACVVIFAELVLIAYGYGYDNMRDDLIELLGEHGHPPYLGPLSPLWKFCWKFSAPLLGLIVMVFTLIREEMSIETSHGHYVFPNSALAFGWFLSLCPLLPIPFFFLKNYLEWTNEGKPLYTLFTIQPTLPSYERITGKPRRARDGLTASLTASKSSAGTASKSKETFASKTKTKSAEILEPPLL